jgi:hypothetical protein
VTRLVRVRINAATAKTVARRHGLTVVPSRRRTLGAGKDHLPAGNGTPNASVTAGYTDERSA